MSSRNNTIAKNTIILYIRMFIVTMITLYTSRLVLQTLGVSDFGIFNLAGSFISFFSVLNTAMSSSVQRFLNVELGRGDKQAYSNAFNTGIEIHLLLTILIIILGESIGLYAFVNWLNIPPNRTMAAMIVYQTALISSATTIFRTPYNAYIIANEKVAFYAYISIFETISKLVLVVCLVYQPYDNLIVYAISILLLNVILLILYMGYVYKWLKAPKFKYVSYTTEIFKAMTKFSSWNFIGNVSYVFTWQGINMMLNVFHGVALNAAMGISNQVTNTISSFTSNFQVAYKPAIIQSYVQNKNEFEKLVCRATKFSFLLLFVILYPLYFNIEYVLALWLGQTPDYTPGFLKILLWSTLISSLSLPLYNALEAHGGISRYQIVASIIQPLLIIYSYIVLANGLSPNYAIMSHVILTLLLQLVLFTQLVNKGVVDSKTILKNVYSRLFVILILGSIMGAIIEQKQGMGNILIDIIIALTILFFIGLDKSERIRVIKLASKYKLNGK